MSKRSRTGYESPLISAALVSSLAVLDIPPQSVRLGPRGAALHTLHWVAGDSHLLRDGLEHRRDRLHHPQLSEVDDVGAHAHPPAEREDEAHDLEGRRVCMTQVNFPAKTSSLLQKEEAWIREHAGN